MSILESVVPLRLLSPSGLARLCKRVEPSMNATQRTPSPLMERAGVRVKTSNTYPSQLPEGDGVKAAPTQRAAHKIYCAPRFITGVA